jgi:hypothetical protein
MISDQTKAELRVSLEQQFRYKFYRDPKFPFLQSIGIKDVFQSFASDDIGYLGTLHLHWTSEDSQIEYPSEKSWPKIKGMWQSKWFEDHEDALKLIKTLYSYFDLEKVIEAMAGYYHDQHIQRNTKASADEEIPVEILN